MSTPQNPLSEAGTSSHSHILIAFKNGDDAFAATQISPISAIVGQPLPNIPDSSVVLNELLDNDYTIPEAMWDFNFIPDIGVSTSASVGKIVIYERVAPYAFLDYLRSTVYDRFNEDISDPISLSQVTFMLKTIFSLNSDEDDETITTINPEPFYFTLDSIESVTGNEEITPSRHIFNVSGIANSTGLLRSFSSIFQVSVTHKDGNIHEQLPVADGSDGGLKTRTEENLSNSAKRKARLDLSKPMINLKDIFDGLESDLNQQKYVHQGQLQRWIRELRSEPNTDKIVISPSQTKLPTPEELPIDFTVDLDPIYSSYLVDNRNMPFEQPDVVQSNAGIRVFPVKTGIDIFDLVERLMLLSQSVGEDAEGRVKRTFKTTITAIKRRTKRYEINIKIRQYILPNNTNDDNNTGPGEAIAPLEFVVNDPNDKDIDVMAFRSNISYRVGDTMLERQIQDNIGAGVVYADREQATGERRPDLSFFESMYSGLRPMIGSYNIDGLESAEKAGDIFNLMDRYTYTQSTDYEMVIFGNPLLMSDVNRNPNDVVNDVEGQSVTYYPIPEVNPMYIKFSIFERTKVSEDDIISVPSKFYFDEYYHMTRVVNIFGYGGENRSFFQKLDLRRTDDLL